MWRNGLRKGYGHGSPPAVNRVLKRGRVTGNSRVAQDVDLVARPERSLLGGLNIEVALAICDKNAATRPLALMTLALRRVSFLDGSILPYDYDVIDDGEIVGRVYRMKADQELWHWTLRLQTPAGGLADSLSRRRRRRSARRGRRMGGQVMRLSGFSEKFSQAGCYSI